MLLIYYLSYFFLSRTLALMAIWEILEAKMSGDSAKKVRKSCNSTIVAVLKSELGAHIFIKIRQSSRLQIIHFQKTEKLSGLMFQLNYFHFVILQIITHAKLSFTSEFSNIKYFNLITCFNEPL